MTSFPIPAPDFNGRSRTVPPGGAFDWLRQGWALFAALPALWIAVTVLLLVIGLGLQIVPLVGMLALHLLTPVFAAGVLHICRKQEAGENAEIGDLFVGFTQSTSALIVVGALYMAAMLVILLCALAVGGGSLAGGFLAPQPLGLGVAVGGLLLSLLVSAALSLPLMMAIWFAPALVFFNHMAPVEALKASFHACLKNTLPFLVYGLIVMVLAFFAALPLGLGFLILIPVIGGSVYAAYRDIFIAN